MVKSNYYIKIFKEYLEGLSYKKKTISFYIICLKRYFDYLDSIGKADIRDTVEDDIYNFVEYTLKQKSRNEKAFSKNTVTRMAGVLKHFFGYLYRYEMIIMNPAEEVDINLKEINKAREIFTKSQMEDFLDSISIETPDGQRYRALFELMYSSGLRINETLSLNLGDIDLKERILIIREGKGGKDRYLPFSNAAFKFLNKYIEDGRKKLIKNKKGDDFRKKLFLTKRGILKETSVRVKFREILKNIGLEKKRLTLHSIRHTCATLLLENGADVRYVQELLGHNDIQTTVRYTHMRIENIKRIYKIYHPKENKYYDDVSGDYLKQINKLEECCITRKRYNEKSYARKKVLKMKKILE